MVPIIGRIALTSGLGVFALALLVLPSLDQSSPEYVVDVLALIISGVFNLLVILSIRWMPHRDLFDPTNTEREDR